MAAIAEAFAVTKRSAYRYLAGETKPTPKPSTWAPDCMTPDELAQWRAGEIRACSDCTLGHSKSMAAEGRCNGIPGPVLEGAVADLDLENEGNQEPLTARKEIRAMSTTTSVRATVNAPCELCIHAEVCKIRPEASSFDSSVDLGIEKPRAWTVRTVVTVDCDFFLAAKKPHKPKADDAEPTPASTRWTPERRAAQAARLVDYNARRHASEPAEAVS